MRFSGAPHWRDFAPGSSRATVISADVIVIALLLIVGSLVNILAYSSREPLLIAIIFFLAGMIILHITPLGGRFESEMFVTVFSVGWFMAGVAAVYANYLNDSFQNFSDAASFFELSRGESDGLGLEEIKVLTEGAGAVVLWRTIYDFSAVLGFEKGRYIGVLLNVSAVAFTGVIAVKMARLQYGNDASRLNRLISLFAFCGLFWLFAAIHLRDAVVLLCVTAIAYLWTRYLAKPEIRNLIFLIVATGSGFGFFSFIRTEFLFVPLAMLIAGLTAMLMFHRARGVRKFIIYVSLFFAFLITGVIYLNLQEELYSALIRSQEGYLELSEASSSPDSLGMALIVNQVLPLRLVIGSVYLFVFPIPFWTGFQLDSAYSLFKSFNVFFFYFLIPLVALSMLHCYRFKSVRTPSLMFNLFLIIGFTMAVAGTSLETRHLGAFLVPIFLVALLPDLRLGSERRAYKQLLLVFVSITALVHIAWVALKFL